MAKENRFNSLQIIAVFPWKKKEEKKRQKLCVKIMCDCFPLNNLNCLPVFHGVLKGSVKPAEAVKSPGRQNTSSAPVSVNLVFQHSRFHFYQSNNSWIPYSFQHVLPGLNVPQRNGDRTDISEG